MNWKCLVGSHVRNGCICRRCGEGVYHVPFKGAPCLCTVCRETFHRLKGCKCTRCGGYFHEWSHDCERCSRCGKTRDREHDWSKDCEQCSKCGKPRPNTHDWDKCKCKNCSKTRDEGHDWSEDCERCSNCGKARSNAHDWAGLECKTCGKKRGFWTVRDAHHLCLVLENCSATFGGCLLSEILRVYPQRLFSIYNHNLLLVGTLDSVSRCVIETLHSRGMYSQAYKCEMQTEGRLWYLNVQVVTESQSTWYGRHIAVADANICFLSDDKTRFVLGCHSDILVNSHNLSKLNWSGR
jgi:hypothetical protein